MRTGNPALNENTFEKLNAYALPSGSAMTVRGTANKTLILLGLVTGSALMTFNQIQEQMAGGPAGLAVPLMVGGAIVGLILSLIISFVPKFAPIGAPLYALAEGLFLGGISGVFEAKFPGIAIQAISATFGTLFALLLAYQTGLIRATENFKLGVFAATVGIGVIYLASFIGRMFGYPIPFVHDAGLLGIGFTAFCVVIAALNLVLDFDFIEDAANRGAPKYMEWYGAFGLMVTLVWLYIEILRLLSKLQSRD